MSKLKFHIVFTSSEEQSHPTSELVNPSPETEGWQTAKLCEYPQEIGIQFEGDVKISKIKVLSHQYKIASKIEFFISEMPSDPMSARDLSYTNVSFKRLGYMSLDTNQQHHYQSRELKSVPVDARCHIIKMVFHKPHVNKLNFFGQVGIVGLNFIGEVITPLEMRRLTPPVTNREQSLSEIDLHELRPKVATVSIEEVKQIYDERTTAMIKELVQLKDQAVQNEDYIEAGRLKDAIQNLQTISAKIVELDRQKRLAVSQEDYARAAALKDEITKLKNASAAYRPQSQHQNVQRLQSPLANSQHQEGSRSSMANFGPTNEQQPMEDDRRPNRRNRRADDSQTASADPMNAQPETSTSENSNAYTSYDERPIRVNPDNAVNKYEAYDNRPINVKQQRDTFAQSDETDDVSTWKELKPSEEYDDNSGKGPTLPRSKPKRASQERSIISDMNASDTSINQSEAEGASLSSATAIHNAKTEWEKKLIRACVAKCDISPPTLSPQQQNKFASQIAAFGIFIVSALCSTSWNLREGALKAILQQLNTLAFKDGSDEPDASLFTICCSLLRMTFADRVAHVYIASLELLRGLVPIYSQTMHRAMAAPLDPLIDLMVQKLGDSNTKLRENTHNTLMFLANESGIGCRSIVQYAMLVNNKTPTGKLPLVSRMSIILDLIPIFHFGSDRINPELTMRFVMKALKNPNGDVRNTAVKLAGEVYRQLGMQYMQRYLETVEKNLIPLLQTEFQAIDSEEGVPASKTVLPVRNEMQSPNKPQNASHMPTDNSNPNFKPQSKKPAAPGKQPAAKNVMKDKLKDKEVKSNQSLVDSSVGSETYDVRAEQADLEDTHSNPKVCRYCGEENEAFIDTKWLHVHYIEECPLLCGCPLCTLIVEIPLLQFHLTEECNARHRAKLCPRCKESVPLDSYQEHVAAKQCLPAKPETEANRCPLCHTDIPPQMEGWSQHLLVPPGCPANKHGLGNLYKQTPRPHENLQPPKTPQISVLPANDTNENDADDVQLTIVNGRDRMLVPKRSTAAANGAGSGNGKGKGSRRVVSGAALDEFLAQ